MDADDISLQERLQKKRVTHGNQRKRKNHKKEAESNFAVSMHFRHRQKREVTKT